MADFKIKEFYKSVSTELNVNENKFLEKSMENILYITDLKSDDNAALLELVKFNEEKEINYNIKVLVTNIKNSSKMIKNLLIFDKNKIIEKNIYNKINFYENFEENSKNKEKEYEKYVKDTESYEVNEIKLKKLEDLNKENFSTCYGFAPFYKYKELIKNSNIFVLGHGYNSEIKNDKEFLHEKIKDELLEISKSTIMVVFNNYVTFTKEGGKINKYNKKIEELIGDIELKERFISQAKMDEINFINNKALSNEYLLNNLKEILNEEEDKKIKDLIINHFEKYNEDLKNKFLKINKNYNTKKVNGKEEPKDFKFHKAAKSIESENILEVTDWSQMKIYLNILNKTYSGDINKCIPEYNKNKDKFVKFVENDKGNFYVPKNVDWDKLFN